MFDIGGVLFDENLSVQYENFAKKINVDPELFTKTKNKYSGIFKTGHISVDKLMKKLSKELNVNKDELFSKHIEMYRRKTLHKDMFSLVIKLKQNYKLAILSNTNKLHTKINNEYQDLFDHFDRIFLSWEMKVAKPDVRAYRYVLKKLKIKPNECVFIDDKEENITSANSIGINGIVFKDYNLLVKELEKLNVKF